MQVLSVRHGTPLIGDEGRKGTRPVVAIRGFDLPCPSGLRESLRVFHAFEQLAARELAAADGIEESLDRVRLKGLARFALGEIAVRVIERVEDTDILRVIGHGEKIQGLGAPGRAAEKTDALAAGEAIGRIGVDLRAEEHIGVEGIGGMKVKVAVVRLPLGRIGVAALARAPAARGGGERSEYRTRCGRFHEGPHSLCEKVQSLNHPKRGESADGIGWYPGGPVRQAAW